MKWRLSLSRVLGAAVAAASALVCVPAAAQSTLVRINPGLQVVAAGAAVPGGITVRALDAGGAPVAGAAVTFTAPASGASLLFSNGGTTLVATTDAMGYAHADGAAEMQPGVADIVASAGTASVVAASVAVPGRVWLEDGWPRIAATGDRVDLNVRVQVPWIPCAYAADAAQALAGGAVSLTLNGGEPLSRALYVPQAACTPGRPYEILAGAVLRDLLPGDYEAAVLVGLPQGLGALQMHRLFTVVPDVDLAAPGDARLQFGLTTPRATEADCEDVAAQVGVAGTSGFPASAPAGVALPYGIARIDAAKCTQSGPVTVPPAPLALRAFLAASGPLPDGTQVWAHGPSPDDSSPHWHALKTTLSGRFALFDLVEQPSSDPEASKPVTALHRTLALGVPTSFQAGSALQDLWWAGPAENGWGMSLTQHGAKLFAALFVYDAQGAPTWLVMSGGSWNAQGTAYTGSLYRPHGTRYDAYNADAFVVGAPVGTLTITPSSMGALAIDYTVDGVSGHKALTRQRFGAPGPFIASSYGDLWWGGIAQNGWGFALAQQAGTMFGVLFTYDANRDPVWFVAPAIRDFASTLYATRGSPWLGAPYDASKFVADKVGSVALTLDPASGTLDLTIDGVRIVKPIEPQPF